MSFNIGTSSTPANTDSVPNMDMALDDMIKSRRDDKPRRTPRKNAGQKSNANAARATGQNKARRNAAASARRGIAKDNRPTGMEIERQVNRQKGRQQGGGGGGGPNRGAARGAPGGRGGGGRQRATAPSAASVRAKARNLAGMNRDTAKNTNQNQAAAAIKAPSQQAIGAAARAMKEHGFKPPKGMQMQISFVPKVDAGAGNNNNANKKGNSNRVNGGGGGQGRGGRR
eukprot:CAMPEP_0181088138 /NCGR_PEP_ID=MMETSP1071-20121207/6630_1 /TAXON_ID=35127 /ORGANISM="Thalassiosira sp., Strain NH16" /LENGTH=227 /DNA_ID=CAMNT_0023170041 /DNA_START=111 /DNA_END=795 /DNA_ORIENTATION=-